MLSRLGLCKVDGITNRLLWRVSMLKFGEGNDRSKIGNAG